jgi:TolB-like protein
MQFAFDDYVIDASLREVRCRGEDVHAEPQVLDLLLHLVRNRDRLVTIDELIDTVWEGRHVSESTIRNRINAARKLVGDDGSRQSVIRTVPRKGLRFVGNVTEEAGGALNDGRDAAGSNIFQIHDGQDVSAAVADMLPAAPGREATKPIVAVLPFTNLGGDPLQEHLADGLSEDIITILAKHRSLMVIARNSVFAFKDRAGDVRQAGAELGADYVVEGSLRRIADNLRVTAHLIQTTSGQLIWANRFDRPIDSLFEMQDEITNTIVASIEPQIGSVERAVAARQRPSSLQSWGLMQLGISHLYRANLKDNLEAQRLLRSACEQDRGLAQAHAHLAYAILLSMLYFDAEPEDARLVEAQELARKALELDDQDAMVRFVYGRVLLARRSYAEEKWYGWVGSNHRPPDPQSGALTN